MKSTAGVAETARAVNATEISARATTIAALARIEANDGVVAPEVDFASHRDEVTAGCGWPLKVAQHVTETPPATAEELTVLRDLHARTRLAHSQPA